MMYNWWLFIRSRARRAWFWAWDNPTSALLMLALIFCAWGLAGDCR